MIKLYRADLSVSSRELLSRAAKELCGCKDAEVLVSEGGKPYFANLDMKFSISHSGERMIIAVSDREIGADIQIKKPMRDGVAKRFFTEGEQEYVFSADSPDEQLDRFYEIWTKKEAYGKWKGCGLSNVLSVDVTKMSFYTEDDGEYALAIYEE